MRIGDSRGQRVAAVGRRLVGGAAICLAACATLGLILIHAARSHLPILVFAVILLVALIVSLHSQLGSQHGAELGQAPERDGNIDAGGKRAA